MNTLAGPGTITLKVGCQFDYSTTDVIPAIVLVRPSGLDGTRLLNESWLTTPAVSYHDYTDIFGNTCRRLTLQPGLATI